MFALLYFVPGLLSTPRGLRPSPEVRASVQRSLGSGEASRLLPPLQTKSLASSREGWIGGMVSPRTSGGGEAVDPRTGLLPAIPERKVYRERHKSMPIIRGLPALGESKPMHRPSASQFSPRFLMTRSLTDPHIPGVTYGPDGPLSPTSPKVAVSPPKESTVFEDAEAPVASTHSADTSERSSSANSSPRIGSSPGRRHTSPNPSPRLSPRSSPRIPAKLVLSSGAPDESDKRLSLLLDSIDDDD